METKSQKHNTLTQYRNLSTAQAMLTSGHETIRVIPEIGAAALQKPEYFRAYRLWLILRHLEGKDCKGLLRLDTAQSRLASLRQSEDWYKTLRQASKLTTTDQDGNTCGFITIFTGMNGQRYVRRHSLEAVIRFLKPKVIGRAINQPIGELICSVPRAKRNTRLTYITRPQRKNAIVSQGTIAKALKCHRSTLSRNLKAQGVKRVANFLVHHYNLTEPEAANAMASAMNAEWRNQQAQPSSKHIAADQSNIGPFVAVPWRALPKAVRHCYEGFYVIIQRLPSSVSTKKQYAAAGFNYSRRIATTFNLDDFAFLASRKRDRGGLCLVASAEGLSHSGNYWRKPFADTCMAT